MSTPQNPAGDQAAPQQPTGAPQPFDAPAQQPYAGQPGQPYGAAPAGYAQQPVVGQKSKVVAGILGILLGGFGIHNFYLGNTNKAILQLVLTLVTCGAASLWGFVEGILILVSKPGTQWHQDATGAELQD